MSYTLTELESEKFETAIHILLERKGVDWMNYVQHKVFTGKADNIPRLGTAGGMEEKTGLLAPTNLEMLPHSNRVLQQRTFYKSIGWDREAEVRMLADPFSLYTQQLFNVYYRKIEDLIIEAGLGTAVTGVGGSGTVGLPSGQKLTDATVDFETLQAVVYAFRKNNYFGDIHGVITPLVEKQLRADAKIQNIDFSVGRVLDSGHVSKFLGIDFFVSNAPELIGDGVNTGKAMFFGDHAIALGQSPRNKVLTISDRPDLQDAKQISLEFDACAVRAEEELVFEINGITT